MDVLPKGLYRILQLFGLFPAELHSLPDGQKVFQASPKLNRIGLSNTCFCSLFIIVCILRSSSINSCSEWQKLNLNQQAMVFFGHLSTNIYTIVNFISVTKHLDQLISVYSNLQKFSDFFHKPSKINTRIEIEVKAVILSYTTLLVLHMSTQFFKQFCVFDYYGAIHLTQSLTLYFMYWQINHICQVSAEYFRVINNELEQEMDWNCCGLLFTDIQGYLPKLEPISPNMLSVSKIRTLAEMYWKLCETVRQANSFFSLPLLIGVFTSFTNITLSLYQFIATSKQLNLGVSIKIGLWVILQICQLIIVIWPCEDLTKAAEETGPILCKYMNKEVNSEVRNELEIFLLQLLHQNTTVSALGFFSLQRHILTTIAGSVSTYLVILIQMDNN